MVPSRLFLAGWQAVSEGVGHRPRPPRAVLGPGRLLPRLLSLGRADCAKHQEPSRKKLLSEKKLVRLPAGRRRLLPSSRKAQAVFPALVIWPSFILVMLAKGHA